MLWLCWESGAGCARGEGHSGHGGSTHLPWGILAPWRQNNLQKCCNFRFPGCLKAWSRCSRPQAPDPAPCSPSPCLFSEKPSPSPRHAQPGGESLQWQEEISERFLCHVSVPQRPPLPFAFSFTSRQLSPGTLWCCRVGSWFMARFNVGDFSPSCLLLFCPSGSAAPQRTSGGGRLSAAHAGRRLMSAERTALGASPRPRGRWGWGGFLQRPCPNACPLLGRS